MEGMLPGCRAVLSWCVRGADVTGLGAALGRFPTFGPAPEADVGQPSGARRPEADAANFRSGWKPVIQFETRPYLCDLDAGT